MNIDAVKQHVEKLLAIPPSGVSREVSSRLAQGAVSVLSTLHGPEQPQTKAFLKYLDETSKKHGSMIGWEIEQSARGTLQNVKDEIDAGLIGSIRQSIAGEVLADFIQLARTALGERQTQSKNVAAVLTAAAFEDTIRRMGEELAGITTRDELQSVLKALKDKGVIEGPQVSIAQSYLKFRNDALHADWDKVERASIESVLSFTEQLLMKHFSR